MSRALAHTGYALTTFALALPFYGLVVAVPFTREVFTRPGWLMPVRSPAGPILAFGCTATLVGVALRQIIVRETPLLLPAAAAYLVGCALLLVVWGALYDLGILLDGALPPDWQEGPGTIVLGVLSMASFGILFGTLIGPVGLPYACLVVWLLRAYWRWARPGAAGPARDAEREPLPG